jgi:adenosylcobinamide-phosphate synthase
VPGALMYKMVNTLDSMIGYRSDRFEQFGKIAAKIDDLFNFIPARITALLLLLISGKIIKLIHVWSDAKKHSSPNAGYPEAALATILNCQFGGDAEYFGEVFKKPVFGKESREILQKDIEVVAKYNLLVMIVFSIIISLVVYYLSLRFG